MRRLASVCIPCALLVACAVLRVEAQEKTRTFCNKADPVNKCSVPADCLCVDDNLEVTFDGKTQSNIKVKAGDTIPVTIMMETVDAGVQGWSYGVAHDDTVLTLNMVTINGTDAKAKYVDGFNATSMVDIQACTDPADTKCAARRDGGGFISAVVLALTEAAELDVKRNSIAISEYTVAKDPGPAGTLIQVTNRLAKKNSPVTAINVTIIGKSRAPVTLVDGFVQGEGGTTPEICNDGIDNDGDGLIDCADPDCATDPACPGPTEICDDGIDNDGDGLIDCADPDCATDPVCQTKTCLDYAYYFGPAATETTLAIGPASSYVISMRNKAPSLGFQLGAKATPAGAATNWEFSGTLGADANRLIELIISDEKAQSRTPLTPNKATSDTGMISSVERGTAIAGFSKNDFFAFDAAPGVGGPGFTVGYVTDLQGTTGNMVPATGEGTPCPVREILRVNLGTTVNVPFSRGDADGNSRINVVDAILIIQIDVGNLPARFACEKILDANDDGTVTVTDAIPVLRYVFEKGANLPAPFRACAVDPTPDALPCTQSNCQ